MQEDTTVKSPYGVEGAVFGIGFGLCGLCKETNREERVCRGGI